LNAVKKNPFPDSVVWVLSIGFLFFFPAISSSGGLSGGSQFQAGDDVSATVLSVPAPSDALPQSNVLFIAVDDLRPELGAYGVEAISTPNIDALAREGVTFTRAYTQMATCSPSRTSLLTGLRPDTARVTDLTTHFRNTVPNVVTLPQYFRSLGYATKGIGKIYHPGLNDGKSWSLPFAETFGATPPSGADGKKLPFAAVDLPTSRFPDGVAADQAIAAIRALRNAPFFIAVGFKKPHLPFVAPPAFFNMYDKNAIPEATNPFRAFGAPTIAFENLSELKQYSGIVGANLQRDESLRRDLKRAYYAATSFVDAQIGRVLAELEYWGLSENTVIVLWGDHGWHLGEQGDWGKHTNFEVGARVPLIIKAPGQPSNQTTSAIVELVDLYPTICELAGVPIPNTQAHGGYPIQGDSIVNLISNPAVQSRRGAFSQWRRGGYVGHSLRTDRYRFTEWVMTGNVRNVIYELYDHASDPEETTNVSADFRYAAILPDLKAALAAGGKVDLPSTLQPVVGAR
jgi:iduronate 2-sulfatase